MVVAVVAAVCVSLFFYFKKHRRNREFEEDNENMDSSVSLKEETLNWDVNTHILTFGDKEVDVGVWLYEKITVTNRGASETFYKVHIQKSNVYSIVVQPFEFSLKGGEEATLSVRLMLFYSTCISAKIEIMSSDIPNSFDKKSDRNSRYITISVVGKRSNRINPNNVKFGSIIGEGSYGTVYRGTYNSFNVAIKKVRSTAFLA